MDYSPMCCGWVPRWFMGGADPLFLYAPTLWNVSSLCMFEAARINWACLVAVALEQIEVLARAYAARILSERLTERADRLLPRIAG